MMKTILKTMLAVVLISLCIIPFTYSALPAPPKPKIFFTWAPGGKAWYVAPPGKFQRVLVWTAYMISSTYGPFTLVLLDYEYQNTTTHVWHYVDSWYTTNLAAGKAYAALTVKSYTDATDVYDSYNVTQATIATNQPSSNPYYLSVDVTAWVVKARHTIRESFSIQYWANKTSTLQSDLVTGAVSPTLFVGTKADYALLNAIVTGIRLGSFEDGGFICVQAEIYDPSLLVKTVIP
jgi:hypothetical protein